ncbi:hypothetical protein OO013_03975 [Mangrovivirga sp. M17]|uniref:Lipocalin-like domain-containing protein n=1 Tax=Mangrovivirga halotolerans TaxID=2993936 RepID=A0ABT3RN31_9BACT|nr:hypothetical protein [Mangrovivirga halotolerans]MCX2743007.1 hypothetical protein [Mangrovivirga halotolerans]
MKLKFGILLFLITSALLTAQNVNIAGLWQVEKVVVGDRDMTPIAKWTRIHGDGTYETGNGWLQNGAGLWSFNQSENTISTKDKYGIQDPFGAFDISYKGNSMVWSRMEEGMEVQVFWERINELPRSHADKITGKWKSEDKDGESHSIFFRWDKIFVIDKDEEKETGYWIPNAHKPEVGFISHDQSQPHKYYKVEFEDDKLILTGVSEEVKGDVLTYVKSN